MTRSDSPAPSDRSDRPLRADARRNRARLIEVADTVFAAKGTSASTEEVARQAGVGIGTVFRHFPTKEALLEAVFVSRLRRLADEARTLSKAHDPGAALFAFFTSMAEQSATKTAYADALADAGIDPAEATAPIKRDFRQAVGTLLAHAQRTGAVRDDIGVDELITLLVGASRAAEHTGIDPETRSRALTVVFDGLRADRAHPDPAEPASPG